MFKFGKTVGEAQLQCHGSHWHVCAFKVSSAPCLLDFLDLKWMQSIQYLLDVGLKFVKCSYIDLIKWENLNIFEYSWGTIVGAVESASSGSKVCYFITSLKQLVKDKNSSIWKVMWVQFNVIFGSFYINSLVFDLHVTANRFICDWWCLFVFQTWVIPGYHGRFPKMRQFGSMREAGSEVFPLRTFDFFFYCLLHTMLSKV